MTTKTPAQSKNSIVGTSIAEQPCQKVIPIYPTRYAVMPSATGEHLYKSQTNLKADFKELEHTSYCLRSLRPNAYIYLYDPAADIKWSCFYHNDLGFYRRDIDKSTGELSIADEKPISYIFANAQDHKPSKVYVGYSDTPYTKKIISGVEGGNLKTIIMQEIDLGLWIDESETHWKENSKVITDIAKTPKAKHTFLMNELEDLNIDYSDKYNTHWSEEENKALGIGNIKSDMTGANPKIQLSIALYDAIGIASELSHLVGYEVTKLNDFVDKNARKVWASSTIDELTRRAGRRAYNKARGINAADDSFLRSGATGIPVLEAHKRLQASKNKAQNKTIAEYQSYNLEAQRQAFKTAYPNELKEIQENIELAGKDHSSWLKNNQEGGLLYSLECYDAEDDNSYIGLRSSFARCIDALPASEAGVEYAKTQLTPTGPKGLFYNPLLGHPAVQEYVNIKDQIKNVGDLLTDDKLIALTALLKKIPPDNGSKTISHVVSALVPTTAQFTSFNAYKTTVYPSSLEALEGVLSKSKKMPLHEFVEQMQNKKTTGKIQTHFRYTSAKQTIQADVTIRYSEEVKVPLTTEQTARKSDLLQRSSFWSNAKIGVSGLGLFLGGYSMIDAINKLNTDDKNILVNSIGLGSSTTMVGSGSMALTQAVFMKRSRLATGDSSSAFKETAEKFERAALGLLAAAAIMAGVKDIVMAGNTSGRRRYAYIGAFVAQTTVAGIATYNLVTKMAEAGNKTAVRMVASSGGKWLARLNPYTGIALLIAEAVAYGLEKYAEAHDDDEVIEWITHSIWGTKPDPEWDDAKEQYELNRLFIGPKIESSLFSTDFTLILSGYKSQISSFKVTKMGSDITRRGKINDKQGIAIVVFDDVPLGGDIVVDYWPDKYNKADIKYSAKD